MGRVAVLFPPLAVSRDFIDYPYFADLGAVQAAAVLAAHGHEVRLVDALALAGADGIEQPGGRILLGAPIDVEQLRATDLVVVAFTPFHRPPRRDPDLGNLLARVRAASARRPIVLADLYQSGQHYVEADPGLVLREYPEVDLLLRYEAEVSLPGLVDQLFRGRPDTARVERGVEPDDLDLLPLPAWDRVDLPAYFSLHDRLMQGLGRPRWAFPIDERSLPLVTSRGCPFRCVHCSSNPGLVEGQPKKQRRKSRQRMARELDFLASLGARRVHVLDELANVNERHFEDLLDLVVERELRLEIPNGLRADYVTDRHLSLLSRRATTLSVSAESGVQRVVDEVVKKELDLARITSVASELAPTTSRCWFTSCWGCRARPEPRSTRPLPSPRACSSASARSRAFSMRRPCRARPWPGPCARCRSWKTGARVFNVSPAPRSNTPRPKSSPLSGELSRIAWQRSEAPSA